MIRLIVHTQRRLIQSGMGYTGAWTLPELREKARYIQGIAAGQRESTPHNIVQVRTGG